MAWRLVLLIPVAAAIFFWLTTNVCMAVFWRRRPKRTNPQQDATLPFVSLLKPVCGLEKGLYDNLATACRQNYPGYEVIYAVQNPQDPALELLEKIRRNHPDKNIQIVVDESSVGPNGRLSNTLNAAKHARGVVLAQSDSDMFIGPEYLKKLVEPLGDEQVGIACTLYKAWNPINIWETLELLTLNADFVPAMVFAIVTRTAIACPGATLAIRREVLDRIGGFEPLGHHLVEDYELGRRVVQAGYRIEFVPHVANTAVDLKNWRQWWRHQVYWDQNTKSVNPAGFFMTILTRGVFFACLYALCGGIQAGTVLSATVGLRLASALFNSVHLKDLDGIKYVWLLPVRDLLGVATWLASFVKRETRWRDKRFALKKGILVEIN